MFIQPLSLQTLLVNTFSGSMMIFTAIAFVVIAALGAKFRMNTWVLGSIFALFGVIMASWIPWFYVLSIIVTGAIVSFVFARLGKN